MASGGGFGPARERAPDLVLRDLVLGKVTPEGARADYEVVIDDGPNGLRVDEAATARLRGAISEVA